MVGSLCLTSHLQRGHLETTTPFTVPCEGREARFLHRPLQESNPGPVRGSPLQNRCATPDPRKNVLYNLASPHEISAKSHINIQ